MMSPRLRVLAFRFLPLFLLVAGLGAQPSGGPYGPVARTYDLPDVSGNIYYVAADGDPHATGASATEPTTLETAFAKVSTGDAIIMRGGVYRTGDLLLNQGITIQPYRDEQPVWKGTRVATEWEALRDGVWRTSWDTLFPMKPQDWWRRHREGMRTPLHRFNNDMVFVDGRFLQSAGWEGEVDEDSYFINYETGEVFLGFDPADHTIEITAFDNAFTRVLDECHGRKSDGQGPTLRGITFTQFAYRAFEVEGHEPEGPMDESEYGKDVTGTHIEDCTITYCSRVAAYLRGDGLVFRHCLVSDTSTEGIYVIASNDVLLEKNIFRRNNIEEITGYYPSAVKIFNQSHRVVCRENLVIEHPHSNGIWYDVGNVDGLFVNNWVIGAWTGFFFEISIDAVCAGNVFVDCDKGVWALNSAGVEVFQNTFINSPAEFFRTTRSAQGDHFGWHPATGPEVDERERHVFQNNLLIADASFDRPLLLFGQVPELCGKLTEPMTRQSDHNTFVRLSAAADLPLISWSPDAGEDCTTIYPTLVALQSAHPELEKGSRLLDAYAGPLVQSLDLQRYKLDPEFPGRGSMTALPASVLEALGWTEQPDFPGAFPPAE